MQSQAAGLLGAAGGAVPDSVRSGCNKVGSWLVLLITLVMFGSLYAALGFTLAAMIFGPLMLAALLNATGIRPKGLTIVLMWGFVFIMLVLYIRFYLVACRRSWRVQMEHALEPPGQAASDIANLAAAMTTPLPGSPVIIPEDGKQTVTSAPSFLCTDRELRDYCSITPSPPSPRFYPFFRPDVDPLNLMRATCWPWTCTITEQHKGNLVKILMFVLALAVTTLLYVRGCPCLNCCLDRDWQDRFKTCTGAGSCNLLCKWYWLTMVPVFVVVAVTFVKGFNYQDLLTLTIHLINIIIKDGQRLIIAGTSVVILLLAYINRNTIYRMLGIEDHNVFHFGWRDLFEPGWRKHDNEPFQVCVWKVTARSAPEAPIQGTQKPSTGFLGTAMGGHDDQEKLLPGQGRRSDIFVRLAYGDNEAVNSRVHYDTEMKPETVVFFKEICHFNLEEISNSLYVTVRDQDIMGYNEKGRIVFGGQKVRDILKKTKEMDPGWKTSGQPLASKQVDELMKYTTRSKDVAEQAMEQVGYKRYNLSDGGAIWIAMAPMPEELGAE